MILKKVLLVVYVAQDNDECKWYTFKYVAKRVVPFAVFYFRVAAVIASRKASDVSTWVRYKVGRESYEKKNLHQALAQSKRSLSVQLAIS